MQIKTIHSDLYESFLEKYPYQSFLHSSYAGNKLENDGWNVEYLGYFNQEECVATCLLATLPLMKVFRYAYIPRGMDIDYKEKGLLQAFIRDLKRYLKKKNVVFLEIDPNIPYQQRDKDGKIVENGLNNFEIVNNLKSCGFIHLPMKKGYDSRKQCRWISGIDLTDRSAEEVFSEFSYMTRQDIRTSNKYQVQVRELQKDELYILDQMEKQTSQHQGFEASTLTYYQDLYTYYKNHVKTLYAYLDLNLYGNKIKSELSKVETSIEKTKEFLEKNPNSTKKINRLKTDEEYYQSLQKKIENISNLYSKYGNEVPLACCLFIEYGKEVVYLVGASNYECRNFKGPYAVQWEMIQQAIKKGYTYYNFYGISGYFNEGEQGYGVFDYKRGYNAIVTEYIGNFVLPIQKPIFNIYKKLKKEL